MSWLITLSPVRALPGDQTALALSVAGDVITINGDPLDLSALADGDVLPAAAVDHPRVIDRIARVGAEIRITLLLPLGSPAPEEARFPAPVTVTEDGPVPLPDTGLPDPEGGA